MKIFQRLIKLFFACIALVVAIFIFNFFDNKFIKYSFSILFSLSTIALIMEAFAKNHHQITDDFHDYSPLLFIGNTTLHTNKQVSPDCSSYRLTLLAHFFDPSPKYGVGGILRMFRNRQFIEQHINYRQSIRVQNLHIIF